MKPFTIETLGSPALRRPALDVDELDEELRGLASRMFATMYQAGGQGLAAPQVGLSLRIAVVDVPPGSGRRLVLVNPRVEAVSEETTRAVEGCLSVPGVWETVTRPAEVAIEAFDPDGGLIRIATGGDLARCLQHEIDHLDGVLYLDRLSALSRSMLLKRYRKLHPTG
jgi:peptide deformylase